MYENRTWEQMKRDNDKACWIDEDGEFCHEYKRDMMKYILNIEERKNKNKRIIAYFNDQQLLSGWQQDGFNGCWSCDNMDNCKRYQNSLPVWKEG